MFPSEPVPERIGAYKVLRRLPGMGSAEVYVGRSEGPMGVSRLCTLKLVKNTIEGDTHFAEELAREAAICAVLNHPSIQRMFDFFEHDRHLVLVLEHIEGASLERLLEQLARRNERLGDAAVAFLGRALAGALAHAHAAKDEEGTPTPVIHRTMHPENVLISWDGQVRLTGFGLGKILGRSPDTVAFVIKGAPGFMAPEQARGERVTPKADVYGLAVLLWSLFSGNKPPEVGTRPARLGGLRPDLPKEVTSTIDAALEPSPDRRKPSCQDLERVLGKVPKIDEGQQEIVEKVVPLRTPRTKPPEAEAGPRKRVALESVRPAKPSASSKKRLSVPPPSRPRPSERPTPPGDEPPASVFPYLRALAEHVPKGGPMFPPPARLPVEVDEERAPKHAEKPAPPPPPSTGRGPSKPTIAAPIGAIVPEGEWKESVPDEALFDQLFDDATSRMDIRLSDLRGDEDKAASAQRSAKTVPAPKPIPPAPPAKLTPMTPPAKPTPIAPPVKPTPKPPDAKSAKEKRMELAATVPAPPVASPNAPPPAASGLPLFAPPPMPAPTATPAPGSALPGFAPPPVPPRLTGTAAPVGAKPPVAPALGAPPVAAAPTPPQKFSGEKTALTPLSKLVADRKKAPIVPLALAGVAAGGIAAVIVSLAGGSSTDEDPRPTSSADSAPVAPVPTPSVVSTASAAPVASSAPTASATVAPGPPPPGQGLLTVLFPTEGYVYVSGKKAGPTNEPLLVTCGSKFLRVSSTVEGRYPEWLSAGESVLIPCQATTQIEIAPGKARPRSPPRKRR